MVQQVRMISTPQLAGNMNDFSIIDFIIIGIIFLEIAVLMGVIWTAYTRRNLSKYQITVLEFLGEENKKQYNAHIVKLFWGQEVPPAVTANRLASKRQRSTDRCR